MRRSSPTPSRRETSRVGGSAPAALTIDAAPEPAFASVPDLAELISLPHDELSDIVARFRGPAGGGRGGGRGTAGQPPAQATPAAPPVERDRAFYQGWLAALKTLDFKSLSRHAQIDYLYIRKIAEQQIARDGVVLPKDPRASRTRRASKGPRAGSRA